jgi:predicted permease
MEALIRDLRYGARMIRKTPGTSFIAVLALSLGIGLTTLMFGIIYGALMRGLPFDQQEEILQLRETNLSRGINFMGVSIHDLDDWRAQQRSFEGLAGFANALANLSEEGTIPVRLNMALMEPAVFQLLGVAPLHGRVFTDEENQPGAPDVLLIGWGVWQQQFGGDPGIIGRTVRLNGVATTIIGVMPEKFGFPNAENAWQPMREAAGPIERGRGRTMRVLGRLRDGVSIEAARTDLEAIAARLAREYPQTNQGVGVAMTPYTEQTIGQEERTVLWTMFGAVVFVLLIACANVANLLLARALVRSKEVGVRTALGASRMHVAMQFLAESFALALAGLIVGSALAWLGIRLFNNAIAGTRPPFWIDIRLDGPALLCAFAATLLATLAAGAIPALRAARANTHDILKDESRGTSSLKLGRLSRALVAAEIALSVGLLVGAGLMIKSVVLLHTIDMGFAVEGIHTARVTLPGSKYAGMEARQRFADELLERVRVVPGISAATLSTGAPGVGSGSNTFALEGVTYAEARDYPSAATTFVSPSFFATLGVDVLAGRAFDDRDRQGGLPVAIVNRAFERRYFADKSALGQRLRLGRNDATAPWLTIVGVAPDLFPQSLDEQDQWGIYLPIAQSAVTNFTILARTSATTPSMTAEFREVVKAIDPDLPLDNAGTLRRVIEDEGWFYKVFGALFISFGAAALFLASVGLYGVMSFTVSQRRREMGVRMAMGARAADLLRLVLRQGMAQTAVGLVLGTAFALAVSRLMSAILFRVQPRDPVIFAAIVFVLVATATLACWVPARRAARTDPLEALRVE